MKYRVKIDKAYCLFEQSGTFKNELKKLGVNAEDYDILDDFGQTDHIVDLFGEINKAYNGEQSIFDQITKDDLVIAFFPCTRFESVIPLAFRGEQAQQKNWPTEKKLAYSMKLHEELHDLYMLVCKLFSICVRGGWRMIVENPYSAIHYLTQYFPVRPKVIDADRTKNGDHFKKPTQYWFMNCEPEQNVIFAPIEYVEKKELEKVKASDGVSCTKVMRSMIHTQYAERFIKTYVMDAPGGVWTS